MRGEDIYSMMMVALEKETRRRRHTGRSVTWHCMCFVFSELMCIARGVHESSVSIDCDDTWWHLTCNAAVCRSVHASTCNSSIRRNSIMISKHAQEQWESASCVVIAIWYGIMLCLRSSLKVA